MEKTRKEPSQELGTGVNYQMLLSTIGGCILFTVTDKTKGRKITCDIEGSANLRVHEGDTFLKKTIQVNAGAQGAVMLKTIQSGAGVSLQISFSCQIWGGSKQETASAPRDQWNEFVDRVWPRYDRNDDGYLSKSEAIRFFSNTFTGTNPSEYDRLFTVFDQDGDGKITKAEAVSFLREHAA